MEKAKGVLKGGWHPSGDRQIHRDSWKSDLKGMATGKKKDPFEEGRNHESRPLSSLKDRKNNALSYTKEIASDQRETGTNLEVTGIRVLKYPPDYNYYGNPAQAGNDLMIFRYPDVVLMVAEARARTNDLAGAQTMVNALRTCIPEI